MPTSRTNKYVWDGIAAIWYSLLFGLAGRLRHPKSAVYGYQLWRGLDLYYHVLGGGLDRKLGDGYKSIGSAEFSTHGGMDLQAWSEPGILHLPRRINRFSCRELNQELYYWLAGVLAFEVRMPEIDSQPPSIQHLIRGVAATSRLLETFPNLNSRYERLCREELSQRRNAFPDPKSHSGTLSTTLELAIRHELGCQTPCNDEALNNMIVEAKEGRVVTPSETFENRTIPFLPVPLWSYRAPAISKFRLPWFKSSRRPRQDGSILPEQSARFVPNYLPEIESGPAAASDFYRYPEWNCFKQEYLKNWCRLEESVPKRSNHSEVDPWFEEMVKRVRKQFKQLQFEPQWKRFLNDGDELDIDSFVSSYADRQGCGIHDSRFYRERSRQYRDLSVIALMDASRSTGAWVGKQRVIDVAKQSLAVLAEVFNATSDNFALYSFSSDSRLRVHCGRIKAFEDLYSHDVRQNLLAVKPQNYTRMGPVIRHLGTKLQARRSTQKLLLVLSDGRPHDPTDRYEGKYALEDTRKALLELRANDIQCFGLTIDQQSPRYLKYLFGHGHYAVYSHFHSLPKVLAHLYVQMTGLSE